MVFSKRSALLVLAAAAIATAQASTVVDIDTDIKNPMVKSTKIKNNKLIVELIDKSEKNKKVQDVEVIEIEGLKELDSDDSKETVQKYKHGEVKKSVAKKDAAKKDHKKEAAKPAKKDHKKDAKPAKKDHKKETKPAKKETKPAKKDTKPAKKSKKQAEPAPTTPAPELEELDGSEGSESDDSVEEEDFNLEAGESADVDVDGETYTLQHLANGTTVITYPNGTHAWLNEKEIYLDFEEEDSEEAGSVAGSGSTEDGSDVGAESESLVDEIENDVSSVAKKFSELATKLTGNGFKDAAPVIFIGGAIGALAAVVGIAAIAVARRRSSEADPESVLADVTEDAEEDVEAGVTDEKKEDEDAEESSALDSSDSESESETEQEEGKFTNEVASV